METPVDLGLFLQLFSEAYVIDALHEISLEKVHRKYTVKCCCVRSQQFCFLDTVHWSRKRRSLSLNREDVVVSPSQTLFSSVVSGRKSLVPVSQQTDLFAPAHEVHLECSSVLGVQQCTWSAAVYLEC